MGSTGVRTHSNRIVSPLPTLRPYPNNWGVLDRILTQAAAVDQRCSYVPLSIETSVWPINALPIEDEN